MTDTAPDLIDVADLDPLDKNYLRPAEVTAGKVSRGVIETRRRAAEGHTLARMRTAGEALNVRHVEDREGKLLTTTAVQQRIDLGAEATR